MTPGQWKALFVLICTALQDDTFSSDEINQLIGVLKLAEDNLPEPGVPIIHDDGTVLWVRAPTISERAEMHRKVLLRDADMPPGLGDIG
jgi:hypothetical protein